MKLYWIALALGVVFILNGALPVAIQTWGLLHP